MKKIFLLFPQKKWGESIMLIGAILFIIVFVSIGMPNKIWHLLSYLFSISILGIGIVRHEHFEVEHDSS